MGTVASDEGVAEKECVGCMGGARAGQGAQRRTVPAALSTEHVPLQSRME